VKNKFLQKNIPKPKDFLVLFCYLIPVYLISYIILSINGTYVSIASERVWSSTYNYPLLDTRVWEPKYIIARKYTFNFQGEIYKPLIKIDRKLWHTNIDLFPNL